MRIMRVLFVVCGCVMSFPAYAQKPSLKGSKASVERMAKEAEKEDLSNLSTGTKIKAFFEGGLLVELKGDENYHLAGVSYPYVRREVRTFVERFSFQSRGACKDGLTVTSSSRPLNEQPKNASKRSVHPAGMAVDFRVPKTARCKAWLERNLLQLEGKRVIEATKENSPAHYHVAVFPKPYSEYLSASKKKAKQIPAVRVKEKTTTKKKTAVTKARHRR